MQSQQKDATTTEDSVLGDYLSRDQLAKQLNVTVRTLARWKWGRQGPASITLGGRVYYKRADVEAWLESLKQEGAR